MLLSKLLSFIDDCCSGLHVTSRIGGRIAEGRRTKSDIKALALKGEIKGLNKDQSLERDASEARSE